MKKLTKAQKTAIKGYYKSRKNGFKPLSKLECLDAIWATLKNSKNISAMSACAGTFFFKWKCDNLFTTHSERNWWTMKKCH
jgi:hypothetical protein